MEHLTHTKGAHDKTLYPHAFCTNPSTLTLVLPLEFRSIASQTRYLWTSNFCSALAVSSRCDTADGRNSGSLGESYCEFPGQKVQSDPSD